MAVLVTLALVLSVAVPAGAVPPSRSEGSLSWLWDLLSTRPSWAFADPPTPEQKRGVSPERGHYVPAKYVNDFGDEEDRAKGELKRYQPHRPDAKRVTTPAAGDGFSVSASKAVSSGASRNGDLFRNADGSYTRWVHEHPVNFKATDGSWRAIDSSLKLGPQGRPQVTANSFGLSFADGLTRSDVGSTSRSGGSVAESAELAAADDLVRLTFDARRELAYSLSGASIGLPAVDREIARYAGVYQNVDLELAAMADGVKETLVFRSADVPTSYEFPLRLKGLTARVGEAGAVEFVDDESAVVATMPVGYMEDAAVGVSGAGAMSHDIRYSIDTGGEVPILKMSVDATWLQDPVRKFPVVLDPTIATTSGDTYVQSGVSESDRKAENNVAVGTFGLDNGVPGKAKALLPFPTFGTSYAGKRLSAATLNVFMSYQGVGGPCVARQFDVRRVTANWSSSVKYDTFPAYSDPLGSASPSSTAACNNTTYPPPRNVGTWVAVPLDTAGVNEWVTGSGNFGLALTASETDTAAWKRFTSVDANVMCAHPTRGSIRCDPFIDITYSDNVPPQVDSQYPSNNYVVGTLTPELAAGGHDPDNWPNKGLRFNFLVYNEQGTQVASSGWVPGVWKVPAGVLAWGKTYTYAVEVDDFSSKNPTATTKSAFTTQVPQPMVTSTLAQNGGKGYEANVGNYTSSDTDAQVAVAGPALSITRDYNSLDTRVDGAFASGWSSVLDMRARDIVDGAGVLQTVNVRYPNGQEVAFGRNNDGTFMAPAGRFSVFKSITGGYSLTDKDATAYEFTRSTGSGVYAITKVTDSSGRAVTFRYDANGRVDQMKSTSSRTLSIAWSTPPNSVHPHVSSVTTDPAVAGAANTALTWNYTYDNDMLTKVCPPGTTTSCATYEYNRVSQHATTVLNTGPYSFWRLNEAAGTAAAASSVLSNDGTDNATYSNAALGGSGPLANSTSTSAAFNGSTSLVALPSKPVAETSYQSISMWFRTSTPTGVLFSYQRDTVAPGATTTGKFNPTLYVGSDGKLHGAFPTGTDGAAMSTPNTVTDGQWHHVALAGNGGNQQLYLDGAQVATLTGTIKLSELDATKSYVGAGFLGGAWPDQPNTTATATYFNGSVADVAFFNKSLTLPMVAAMHSSGRTGTAQLTKVTSEAGRVQAEVSYDTVSGRTSTVTDENGSVWKIGAPTAYGSSQVYVSSVLGSQPTDYWRLGDVQAPVDAVNVVHSNEARYNNVTFDTTQPNTTSPFPDTYGAVFNGTSSFVKPYNPNNQAYPGTDYPLTEATTVEMWFKVPANHAASGVLYSYQFAQLGASIAASWTPALYVGADGYLRGGFWTGSAAPVTSAKKVNDGQWHHVVLSASNTLQLLYLDNTIVGGTAAMVATNAAHSYIGAGATRGWPGSSGDVSYFKGNIAEVAYYNRALSPFEVDAHFRASKSSLAVGTTPTLTPVSSVTITDPTQKTSKQVFDLLNGGRMVASTDVLGQTTSFGYDIGGYESVVYDPLGMKSVTGRDVRGNTIRSTVCRDQEYCDTTYYKYWPDATTVNLTPDPRNDQLIEIRDARSQSESDNKYLTKLAYDTSGNRLSMTTPPIPGYPNGRTTTMTYTTATTAAVGGGTTPAGLPLTTKSPGNAQQSTEYNAAGDVVRVTDAAGLATEFSYDGLGRTVTKTVKAGAPTGDLTTTFVYDSDGQVVEQIDPPVLNQVTGATHTAKTTTSYDADGNVTYRKVEDTTGGDAYRDASSFYNSYGQVVKTVDAAGTVTLFEYDPYGNNTKTVTCDSNPSPSAPCPTGDRLRTVEEIYDAAGQQLTTTVTGQDGTATRVSSKAYYANGNLASDTDAMNWVTSYEYDLNDNVTKVTRTDGVKSFVQEENKYDAVGNPTSRRSDNGANWSTFEYDEANRLRKSVLQPFDLHRVTSYQYDADDHPTSTRNSVGQLETPLQTIDNTYDPMGNVTSESVSVNHSSGPSGWWKMEEPGPAWEAFDSSPSQQTLASYNGAIARSGGAAVFNGTTLYQTQQPVLNTTQSYSVSAWVKLNNFTTYQTFVGEGGSNHGAFFLQYSKGLNKWAFISPSSDSASPSAYYSASSAASLTTNTWVHLVGVFDSGTKAMTLYVNGAQGGTGTNPTPFNAITPLGVGGVMIGAREGDYVNGAMDNVQVFQRALSASEASTLYGAGNGRSADTTVTGQRLTTKYTVDKRGLTTAMTDPMGNLTSYEYDSAGQLAKVVAPSVSTETSGGAGPVPAVPVSRTGYNTFGEATETQDPLTNTVTTRYDAAGRPVETRLPDYTPPGGSTITDAKTITVYDKLSQVASTTDPLGKTTTYGYDSLGNTVRVTDPRGKVSTAAYNKVGDPIESVDPTGAKTTATYDFLGRKLTSSQVVRQPTPTTNTTTYDYGSGAYGTTPAAGPWLQKVTSPDGVVTSSTYNWVGEPLTVKDGAGNVTTTEYDGLGRAVKTILADNTKQTLSYDGAGRVVQTQNLDASNAVLTTQSMGYDDNGNVTSVKDARNTTTTFSYDALGRVTGEVQPVTATKSIGTSFGYDLAGNRTRFTDGRGNPFWTTYNSWGLPESQIEPSTTAYPNPADRTFTTSYDAAGRPKKQTMPGGVTVSNTYDEMGRIKQISGAGAEVATADRMFDYDDAGRLTSLSVPSGTNTLSYDDRGLPLTISGPNDNASFSYTRDGRMASRSDAAGTTSYTYDTAGRFKTATNPTTGINLTIGYNNLSLPAAITYGTNNNVRTLTYDALHRLKTDTVKTSNGAQTLGSITYGYDNNGNETSKVTTGFTGAGSNTYTYDLADRLTSWTNGSTTSYTYDDSGNRTQAGAKVFTYDARNQLTAQTGVGSYAYTARGTLRQTTVGTVTYATTSNAFGEVLSQQGTGGVTSTYQYDALGRVVRPGFKYSGLGNTLAQDNTATYTRGPEDALIGVGSGAGASSLYAWTDQHTDLVGLLTASGATLSASTTYNPLGTVTATSGMAGSLGYQSEWTDSTTGRVNMLARWYNPDTAQFDSRDTVANNPLPDSVTANRFQYGDANPLTTTDPTGHWGIKSFFKAAVKVVSNPVATYKAAVKTVTKAYDYVKTATKKVVTVAKKAVSKAKKAYNVVKESTVRWAKKKINTVKDAYHSANKCLSSGVGKCVKATAKKAVKSAVASVQSTVDAIKQDPWKFFASAAVGLAAAVAVGALCATGVGCLILAGAVAGAMSAGAGYMTDVAQGDEDFSWSGLASNMVEGGLDGAWSAGASRLTGGLGTKFRGGSGGRMPRVSSRAAGTGGSPSSAPERSRSQESSSSGSGCSRHSFDPATRVLMANGNTKPIEDVELGDEVATTDPATGESTPQKVTYLHVNVDDDLTDVTVRDGKAGATSVVKTTEHHPFWDATDRRWVDAAQLTPGHRLLVHDDKRLEGDSTGAGMGGGGPGHTVTVVQVANVDGSKTMRDLTVDNTHTYYVVVGDQPVLVHNCGEAGDASFVRYQNLPAKAGPWKAYQEHVTGRDYEEVWSHNGRNVQVDGGPRSYVVEAKWMGRNDAAFESSPYHPSNFFDEAKFIDQTQRLLDLGRDQRSKGVRYAVSNKVGADFTRALFRERFPEEMESGFLGVFHVPGDGM
ncbi:LamG-like jellyroll fold domain-containing protein [Micromonospora orduensis]|uniref:LamG-like jellyroll fold domain-containing protein n=1 Tax=Micromonospora orduensis TaxID=1420891 RepID=UPI00142F0C17|nr:LamG-like jellyroll fold domain-containing protein [Micromonospora orduensis]